MVHFRFITLLSSYVDPMYSYVANVFVFNLYVTRMICTRIVLICYSYVTRMLSYVSVCYPYVLVWCFSHDPS